MAEFDLDKIKEESQMFDTWRQGRQRAFDEKFPLSTVAPEDLNFPEFTPESPYLTENRVKDPFAYENQPFVQDSPFATNTATFDPYESFREYTSDELTNRSKAHEQEQYDASLQRGKDIIAGFDQTPEVGSEDWAYDRFKEGLGDLSMSRPQGDIGTQYNIDGQDFEIGPDQFLAKDYAGNYIVADKTDNTGAWGGEDKYNEMLAESDRILGKIDQERLGKVQGERDSGYDPTGLGQDLQNQFDISKSKFDLQTQFDAPPTEAALELKGQQDIEDRTKLATEAGYGSLEEYDEAMSQWKPFDPKWRRAKGKATPLQDRRDRIGETLAPKDQQPIDYGSGETEVPTSQLEDLEGLSEDPEYEQWLNEYHPFDPEWRKAKGKYTPFQKDEELVIPTETEGRAADYLGPVEEPATDVLPSQLEDIDGVSEGEGAMYVPDRPSVPIESEDVDFDMDIDIQDTGPMDDFTEYEPYSQDLKDDMVKSGKYDENLTYEENSDNYNQWVEGYHPFDQDWRKAKGKHLFDPQARGAQTVEQANQDYDNLTQENKTLYDSKVNELETTINTIAEDRPALDSKEVTDALADVYGFTSANTPTEEELESIFDGTSNNIAEPGKVDALRTIIQGENYQKTQEAQKELDNLKNNPNSVEGYQTPGEQLELKDVKGTEEYKVEQKRLKEEEEAAAIDRGEGYHPDDEEWRESKTNWDKNEDGVRDPSVWETPHTQELSNALSRDFKDIKGEDEENLWNDANNDGIVSSDELDWDNLTDEQRSQFNDYQKKSTEEHYNKDSKNKKKHGGENEDGEWQDKDYWRSYYKEADKVKRKAGRGKWQPFSHEWRKEHNKFTLRAKTLEDFNGDETKFNEYKKQRTAKIDMWAEIFKGGRGEFGGLSAMFFAMAGSNPYEYKQYIGGDKD